MKIFLPLYYKEFKCIAERCRHSCCVGWEIGVDKATLEKYEILPDREDILCHIKNGEITLCENGSCPFLRGDGLCRIIVEHGEAYTSEICREHPRFYHRVGERVEGGIGASCEEAARIILSSDSYADFVMAAWCGEPAEETDYDTISQRKHIYELLGDRSISYCERIKKIKERYVLSHPIHSVDEWKEIFFSLEYLDEGHRGLFRVGKTDGRAEMQTYFERFLAYLVFRHVSVAESYDNLRARLSFCLLLTGILESFVAERQPPFDELTDFVRIISEEIEYSEDNTASLIFEIECAL